MTRVFIMHNLRPGTSQREYEEYAKKEYVPTLRSLPSVCEFNLYRGLAAPPGATVYEYIGVLDVSNLDDYEADTQTQLCSDLQRGWASRVTDVTTVVGEPI